jgi:hypothetical protein
MFAFVTIIGAITAIPLSLLVRHIGRRQAG